MRLAHLALRPGLARRTVRLRLTLLYGGLFLVSGATLLAITYVLVRNSTGGTYLFTSHRAPPGSGELLGSGAPPAPQQLGRLLAQGRAEMERLVNGARHQRAEELDTLLVQSGIALAIMAVASIALGWLVAGRVLAPLRTMTATARGISEANLNERLALEGPHDELKELGDTIDNLLERLEGAFEAQRRFVANASHELRTPLAMMRTSLDVATGKPGPVSPQVTVLGAKFREGLDQADRLLEGFLTLARAQHRGLPDASTVDLGTILSAAIGSRREAIFEQGLKVSLALDEIELTGSETLLTRMADNLIDNAIRHNIPGGLIAVEAHRDGAVAELTVQSSGSPLDPAEVRELAQPFLRLGAQRTGSENGVGLGLSIVAAIAAAHAGRLELKARPEGGLLASVKLPLEAPQTRHRDNALTATAVATR